jgi:hypothetical protein
VVSSALILGLVILVANNIARRGETGKSDFSWRKKKKIKIL